ncbi:MAG: hypothetical protein LUD15_10070 [Bacteroides sp.]|nr:hypothetical protein [Bacteroides sp.]
MNEGQLNISHTSIAKNNFEYTTTHYKKIRSENGYSLLELHPEGSFRNQIRFHMHELKSPVVGDFKYNPDIDPIGRLALHDFKLIFIQLVTGEKLEFEIPHVSEFKRLVAPVKQEDTDEA